MISDPTRPATASAVSLSHAHRRFTTSLVSAFTVSGPPGPSDSTVAPATADAASSPWLSQSRLDGPAAPSQPTAAEDNSLEGSTSQPAPPGTTTSTSTNTTSASTNTTSATTATTATSRPLSQLPTGHCSRRSRWSLDGITHNVKTIARRASHSMRAHILPKHRKSNSDTDPFAAAQAAVEHGQDALPSNASAPKTRRSSFFRGSSIPNLHLSSQPADGSARNGAASNLSFSARSEGPPAHALTHHPSFDLSASAAVRAAATASRPVLAGGPGPHRRASSASPAALLAGNMRMASPPDSAAPSLLSSSQPAGAVSAPAETGITSRFSRLSTRSPRRLVPWRHSSMNIAPPTIEPAISRALPNVTYTTRPQVTEDEQMCDSVVDLRKLDLGSTSRGAAPRKVDPAVVLPPELMLQILSHVDASALARCLCVSRTWNEFAKTRVVWKSCFLQQYGSKFELTPPRRMVGSMGIGPRNHRGLNFCDMYRARQAIDQNWKACAVKAIYFNGHTDSVYCCQFDESKLITGSRDKTIRVWCMKTYKCLLVVAGNDYKPVAEANERQLATHASATVVNLPSVNGTADGNAIFFSPPDFHTASILCLQYDDELLVTGSSDHTCIVWDIKTFQPLRRLRHHTAGVLDVCLDSKFIISCSKDAKICVWSRQTHKLLHILLGHEGPVNAVQLRGNLLASASGDGYARLWDLNTMTCIGTYQSVHRSLATVEFSNDGRYILTGGNDQVIYKFDTETGRCVHVYIGHNKLVRSLFLDAHNNRIISGSYDQGIRVFNFETDDEPEAPPSSDEDAARPVRPAIPRSDPCIEYMDWTTSWILSTKSDYRRIVATSQDGRALLMDFGWDVENVEMLQEPSVELQLPVAAPA